MGRGRIVERRDEIVVVEASLADEKGTVASAIASILIVPMPIPDAGR